MNQYPSQKSVKQIRDAHPTGTRIQLLYMPSDLKSLPAGTFGNVTSVDDIGNIHMKWDNGSSLALIPHIDKYEIIKP